MPRSPDLIIFMLMRTDKTDFFIPYCACVHMPKDDNKIFKNTVVNRIQRMIQSNVRNYIFTNSHNVYNVMYMERLTTFTRKTRVFQN